MNSVPFMMLIPRRCGQRLVLKPPRPTTHTLDLRIRGGLSNYLTPLDLNIRGGGVK